MDIPAAHGSTKAIDSIQECLTNYAYKFEYDSLSTEAVHAAKVRVIDTLGALIGGFFGPPCQMGRNLAARVPDPNGATIIGTRWKSTPEMAAFANATAARYVEANDVYRWPRSTGGHPSDVVTPILAVAEHAGSSGRDFIAGVVLAYEVYCRISDSMDGWGTGVEPTNFACLGIAVASAKMLGLPQSQVSHCISVAAMSNLLRQVRTGHLTAWKAVAAGQAGRAGVFAAMLAREGMAGPHLPFEGKHGWCAHVSKKPISLATMGGNGTPFKVEVTLIKPRCACAATISSILAAEKIAPRLRSNIGAVKQVIVEVYKNAKVGMGTAEHHWNPDSRETADHSIPYVVAAAFIDGTVTSRQFNEAHLWRPELRTLLQKIEVVANDDFTRAYERLPVEHRTRITVVMANGERIVGESGGNNGDLSDPKSDAEIEEKFRSLAQDYLGEDRSRAILDRLWNLEDLEDVAAIPSAFVFT